MPDLTIDEYRRLPKEVLHQKLREESVKIYGRPVLHMGETLKPVSETSSHPQHGFPGRIPFLTKIRAGLASLITRSRTNNSAIST